MGLVRNESMTDRNGKRKEESKESDSDEIDSLSDKPEEDEEEVASEEEESEEVARPVKKGPTFGAAAAKK